LATIVHFLRTVDDDQNTKMIWILSMNLKSLFTPKRNKFLVSLNSLKSSPRSCCENNLWGANEDEGSILSRASWWLRIIWMKGFSMEGVAFDLGSCACFGCAISTEFAFVPTRNSILLFLTIQFCSSFSPEQLNPESTPSARSKNGRRKTHQSQPLPLRPRSYRPQAHRHRSHAPPSRIGRLRFPGTRRRY